ncbi:hypothetical protein GCM10027168_34310 [Streptomyces capparidis]
MTATTRYDRYLLRTMNDPRLHAVSATAVRRRLLVAAHVVLTAAAFANVLALKEWPGLLATLPFLVLVWCVTTGAVNAATRGLLELRARVLDERQLAERGRVHTLAHRATLAVAGLALAVSLVAEVPVPAPAVAGAAVAVLWLMPLWTACLTVRDEPGEEPAAA